MDSSERARQDRDNRYAKAAGHATAKSWNDCDLPSVRYFAIQRAKAEINREINAYKSDEYIVHWLSGWLETMQEIIERKESEQDTYKEELPDWC